MTDPNIFNHVLVWPIINTLVAIYKLLFSLNIPFALGFSIIGLTVFLRFIMYPLTHTQLKASKKMQELSPHLSKLKEKHKGDAKTLQQETMKLYKEFGVNPAAGCLPVLVQIPVIWGLYSVLIQVVNLDGDKVVSSINQIVYFDFLRLTEAWETSFFGLHLGQNPASIFNINNLFAASTLILFVPILTGFFQFIQSKMMMAKHPKNKLEEVKKGKKKQDFASSFQSQSLYIFPLMIGFFSYGFPIGLSLYWNTFSIFGIVQQYQISGWGGLGDIWSKKKK